MCPLPIRIEGLEGFVRIVVPSRESVSFVPKHGHHAAHARCDLLAGSMLAMFEVSDGGGDAKSF